MNFMNGYESFRTSRILNDRLLPSKSSFTDVKLFWSYSELGVF